MNKTSFLINSALFVSITVFLPQLVQADIFKCVNQQGAVFYNDKPCPVEDKEIELLSVKDPKNGYISKLSKVKAEKEDGDRISGTVIGTGKKVIDNSDDNSRKINDVASSNAKNNMKQADKKQGVASRKTSSSAAPLLAPSGGNMSTNDKVSTKLQRKNRGENMKAPGRIL